MPLSIYRLQPVRTCCIRWEAGSTASVGSQRKSRRTDAFRADERQPLVSRSRSVVVYGHTSRRDTSSSHTHTYVDTKIQKIRNKKLNCRLCNCSCNREALTGEIIKRELYICQYIRIDILIPFDKFDFEYEFESEFPVFALFFHFFRVSVSSKSKYFHVEFTNFFCCAFDKKKNE